MWGRHTPRPHSSEVVAVSKQRKTFSLDDEVVEELNERNLNASGVANDLLTEYLIGGTTAATGKEIRIQHIEQEIEQQLNERDRINRRIERLRNERERLEREIEKQQSEYHDRLEEAAQFVRGKPADNPAVENWANKLNMTPEELLTEVERKLGGTEGAPADD